MDGFGSQYTAWMSADAIATRFNLLHCRSKRLSREIHVADHLYSEMSNFLVFTGFENLPFCDEVKECAPKYGGSTLSLSRWDVQKICEDLYSECISPPQRQRLRAMYGLNNTSHIINKTQPIKVAVHIRRGDVNQETNIQERFCPISTYENAVQDVLSRHSGESLHVSIFSNPNSENQKKEILQFNVSGLKKITFNLNMTAEKTFHELVLSNVIISYNSDFGISAAILIPGTNYVPNMHRTCTTVAVKKRPYFCSD